ncbi:tandem-95 repeat protein [Candidatus Cryosericum terrychapinii]|jgi:hypothetical protein|uniref:Tandem-95 repeat protein n=1 Tax=Candidatus Cryosericum terrychapinii TaxID=2290919 RepID=A0A398D3Q0_9BACT|nr:Ig-like domain-containing protein [Candidatus Cryosericum terrychapinii]RIE06907.1 tandem-95 repeat protein [Candidatus Cryosericum terrychapinii]
MTSGRVVKRLFGKAIVALLAMLLCSASLAAPVSAVTAANDAYTTNEDIAVNCTVLTNDSGTGLRVDSTGTPGHGTANIVSGGGSITYTPNANWNGTDSFTYTVLQSANPYYSGTSHYYEFVSVPGGITWSAAQTAAAGKHLYGLQGYLVTITSDGEQNFVNTKLNGTTAWMGASDVSSEGTWCWVTGPEASTQFCTETGGGGYGNSTGGYTAVGSRYNNWNGGEPNNSGGDEDYGQFLGGSTGLWNDLSSTATVAGYVVEYGGMAGDPAAPVEVLTATVTVTVNAVNDAPVNTALPTVSGTMNVGDTLTATSGTWNDNLDMVPGTLSYEYVWQRADSTAGANLTVIPGANSSTYVIGTGSAHKYIRISVNCTDTGEGLPSSQSTFAYSAWSSQVANSLPIITEGASTSVTMSEDGSPTAFSLTLHATDVDGDTLTWSISSAASHGTATASGTGASKSIGYAVAANYNGSDSFVVRVSDTYGGTDDITVNVTITAVNDAPSFTKGGDQTAFEDTGLHTVVGWASAMSAGPADESSQTLAFNVTNDNNALFSVQPAINSGTGTLTYTLAADANGPTTVTVTLGDNGGTANGGVNTSPPQTFTITVTPVNDMPSFTKGADQTVLEDCGAQTVNPWATAISVGPANEIPQVLTFIATNNNNGLFSVQPAVDPATGILTYTPAANMNGVATVSLTLTDDATRGGAALTTAAQTFNITVTPVNDPPVNTAVPVISGIPHVGRTLATTDGVWNDLMDTSVSGTSALSYAYQWQRSTDGGTIFADIPGAVGPTYILTLADNLQPVRSKVTCTDDGVGLPLHQTTSELSTPVSVTILNAAPVITEGASVSTACDEDKSPVAFTFTLHATDSDAVDTLTWHILASPAHGTLTLPAPSVGMSIVPSFYHPASNWNGVDSFTLQVDDGLTGTATITVTVTVNPRNDAPVSTVHPGIAGSLFVNYEVRSVVGSWNDAIDTDVSGTSVLSYTYQWLRARDAAGTGLVLIPGATASTYVVSPIDGGMYLAVRVTCTDNGVGLPATMSTTVDSAFLSARSLDMVLPTIDLPDFFSWPGVTSWSGAPVQTFVVNSSPFSLQFTLEDNSGSAKWTIKVNGVVIVDPVGAGVITYPVPLSEGRNDVEISASDASGNTASVKLAIYLDTMGPVLTVEPALPSSVTTSRLTIAGSVGDAVAGLKWVSINGTAVIPYLDGSFQETLTLTRGINRILIEAEDKAGHTATATYTVTYATTAQPLPAATVITLTIGRTKMDVSGRTVALDTAPVIKESRTLLPLRALVHELGGSIAWNAKTRQVTVKARGVTMVLTIGKNTATVSGKSILIDPANSKVVPIILGGRTFLPVRFIAEQLGLEIGWYPPTRTITITWEP